MLGGDGFQPIFHPTNSQIIWAETQRGGLHVSTDGGLNFNSAVNGIDPTDRTNWDCPIIMSSHNSNTLYTGTYRIYKNTQGANENWISTSPDLTDGIIFSSSFHTISTIAESSIDGNHLYVGTSDANVWRSLNGGTNWTNITGTLPDRYVTSVKASPNNTNTVFVTHSGYKYNDFIPHVHRSIDNGTSWTDISGNLPQVAVNDIIVYPGNDDILFVASDAGVYVTLNGGADWNRIGNNMPVIPVLDLDIEPVNNRLIAGTHARSMMTFPIDSILISTEVGSIQENEMNIYPNPTSDQINIETNEKITNIIIYDLRGNIVKQFSVSSKQYSVNVRSLASGKYFLQSISTKNNNVSSFIKY
ncbi:MAG: T9SS type A sorting domain-containing protein [Bacteroidia bacterium]|nr:T9SS type A sorting domain-containing protein [Bacteroidia bacterium]